MIKVTKYANKFNKKVGNFLDNPRIIQLIPPYEYHVEYGCRGFTQLHEKHLPEFFLWLDSSTRNMVLAGKTSSEIIAFLDSKT